MPQIIVTATTDHELHEGTVLLRERVSATDFESDRFTANLLERLGWAVEDATEAEERKLPTQLETLELASLRPDPQPDWHPEPAGIA
jgi:hypothetical protein